MRKRSARGTEVSSLGETYRGFLRFVSAAIKFTVTVISIAVIYRLVDSDLLLVRARGVNLSLCAVALVAAVAQIVFVGYRWRYLVLQITKGDIPTAKTFIRGYYIAQLFGQVMPFVAGDALRAYLLNGAGVRWRTSIKSVLIDRAMALLVLLILVLPVLLASPIAQAARGFYLPVLISVLTALIAASAVFAIAGPLARFGARWRVISFTSECVLDMRTLLFSSNFKLVGYYVATHGVTVLIFWLLARSQQLPIRPTDAAAVVLLSLVVQAIPIAIAGWGVREAFVIALMVDAGIPSESALLLSLSFGAILLMAALPGGVIWIFSGRPRANQSQS